MMKYFLILLLPFCSYSQLTRKEQRHLDNIQYTAFTWETVYENRLHFSLSENLAGEKKVKTVQKKVANKRGKIRYSNFLQYNNDGNIVCRSHSHHDSVFFSYEDTLLTHIVRKSKKVVYNTDLHYDEQHRMTERKNFKNGNLSARYSVAYYKENKRSFVEEESYRKKKRLYRMEYTYDTLDNRLTKSAFFVNGKQKRIWLYECNERGKSVDLKQEALSSSCRFEQTNNDGSYSVFNRTLVEGKFILYETLFSKDSLAYGFRRFENDSILVLEQLKEGNITTFSRYSKKGKLRYQSISTTNDQGDLVEQVSINKRKKITNRQTITYNDQGLPETILNTSNNEKTSFEYSFF